MCVMLLGRPHSALGPTSCHSAASVYLSSGRGLKRPNLLHPCFSIMRRAPISIVHTVHCGRLWRYFNQMGMVHCVAPEERCGHPIMERIGAGAWQSSADGAVSAPAPS